MYGDKGNYNIQMVSRNSGDQHWLPYGWENWKKKIDSMPHEHSSQCVK